MQTSLLLDAWAPNAAALSTGLLIARLIFGLGMSAHGAQKLFGWFGGYGLTKTGEFLAPLGFRPGRLFAAIASSTEVVAGLLIAFGLLRPRRSGADALRHDRRRCHGALEQGILRRQTASSFPLCTRRSRSCSRSPVLGSSRSTRCSGWKRCGRRQSRRPRSPSVSLAVSAIWRRAVARQPPAKPA